MQTLVLLLSAILFIQLRASAQNLSPDLSKVDIFAGASFAHMTGPTEPSLKIYGGAFSATYNVNRLLSWAAEYAIYKNSGAAGGRAETILFGPKISLTLHKTGRFVPYAQWLFGAVHSGAELNGTPFTSTNFAESAGLGLDVIVTHHLAIRPFEADYLFLQQPVFDPSTGTNDATFTGKSFRYSGGIVFRF